MMPYRCPFCSRRFRRRDGLVLHVRTHTGERPYACPHCPVAFAQKSHLNRHIRTVHKVEPNAHLGGAQASGPPAADGAGGPTGEVARPEDKALPAQNGGGGQAADSVEAELRIPSPLFPHVQISSDAGGVV
nr:protein glass-like [Penaeus vannamei]